MSATGLEVFDTTLQATHVWLEEVRNGLGWNDRRKAYHALRAVLHALRDRLPVNEAVDLAAQMPMLIRGFYYEGWRPAGKPVRERSLDEFLTHVTDAFLFDAEANAREIAKTVFHVLARHVSAGEIKDVRQALPREIGELFV